MSLNRYRYEFKPIHGYWFTSFLVNILKNRSGCIEATLDIGLSSREMCIEGRSIRIEDEVVDIDVITPSDSDRVVLYEPGRGVYEVTRATPSGFYKLKAIDLDKAPTLEVSGIHMHRITGIDPWRDTLLKVKAGWIKAGNIVLDTCMGLGYTAIASISKGAERVFTFEIDENVIWIAERNPWSRGLVGNEVNIFHGDVTRLILELPNEFFHRVIHDPPRFSKSTGELYSLEFYRELYRVLRYKGILFHYTGEPRRHGLPSLLKGIKERLEKAGFKVLRFDVEAEGYIAIKL